MPKLYIIKWLYCDCVISVGYPFNRNYFKRYCELDYIKLENKFPAYKNFIVERKQHCFVDNLILYNRKITEIVTDFFWQS